MERDPAEDWLIVGPATAGCWSDLLEIWTFHGEDRLADVRAHRTKRSIVRRPGEALAERAAQLEGMLADRKPDARSGRRAGNLSGRPRSPGGVAELRRAQIAVQPGEDARVEVAQIGGADKHMAFA